MVVPLALLFSATTTVSATSLIALKIVLVTRRSRMQHSYAKIVEILIESAALVSIVLLGVAILELISYVSPYKLGTTSGRHLFQMLQYLSSLYTPVTVRTPRRLTWYRLMNMSAGNLSYPYCFPHSGGIFPD